MENKTKIDFKPGAEGGTVTGQTSIDYKGDVGGVGVTFSLGTSGKLASEVKTVGDNLSWTDTAEIAVTAKGGVSVKEASVKEEHTEGVRATYNVVMPKKAAEGLDIHSVTPYDPASMPVGTKVSIDGTDFDKTKLSGSFKHVAMESRLTMEQGDGVLVEKTSDHTVRVMAGPREMLARYDGLGVEFGKASVMLGREDKLETKRLQTAEFDLSTPDGQQAYNRFLGLGVLPGKEAPGVTGVSTVESMDLSSAGQLGVKLGKLEKSVDLQKNTGEVTVTKRPDGSLQASELAIHFSQGVPLTIRSKFDKDGNEVVADRRYEYTFDANPGNLTELKTLSMAEGKPDLNLEPGQKVTLSFTEAQMRQLEGDMRSASHLPDKAAYWIQPDLRYDEGSDPSTAFALKMAATYGDQVLLAQSLRVVYQIDLPGNKGMPGTLKVQGQSRNAEQDKHPTAAPEHTEHLFRPPAHMGEEIHPAHGLFTQIRDHVHALDAQHGRTPTAQSDNLAGVLTVAAVANGMTRAEGVAPNTNDASTMFVFGAAGDAAKRVHAEVPTVPAMNTPLAASSQEYQRVATQQAQGQPQTPAQPAQENQQAQAATR